jgi:endonuclease YncB( thermonuclease family)
MRVRPARLLAAALAGASLLLGPPDALRAADAVPACAALEPGPTHTVTRIVDGETLALDDGSELRLIGVLAPRAIDVGATPGTWRLEAVAVEALQGLLLGKTVEVRFDGERNDRYGRLKGHAFLKPDDAAGWVQGHLLGMGLARAYTFAGHRACWEQLLAAERTAREARLGLWAEAAYEARPADASAALLRHVATFQLVEGQVAHVALTRSSIYLNFGPGRRRGFSASLKLGDRAQLGAFSDNPKGLEGALVRVRGWIEERAGEPYIELSAAGGIEVIAAGAPRESTAGHTERRWRAK